MIDPVPPIAKCPNCGTTMEISFDTQGPTGERPLYIQTGDLLASQPSPKAGSDPDLLRYRNEQRAARLTVQRWSQEEGYPSYTNSDKSDTAFLDTLIPAPLSEQLLPYLALVAVILGFIALCSLYPVTLAVIVLNPLLVALYLHRKAERRQKAQRLIAGTHKGRTTRSYMVREGLQENWRGAGTLISRFGQNTQ